MEIFKCIQKREYCNEIPSPDVDNSLPRNYFKPYLSKFERANI